MKIREGFVSNSSSSSFIIGLAKVEDLDLFKFKIENKKFPDIEIKQFKKIVDNWDLRKTKENIVLGSFNYSEVTLPLNIFNEDDYIVTLDFTGNEGDCSFYEDFDINYNINYSFFDTVQQEEMDLFNEANGLSNVTIYFGAGRNG